MTIEYHEPPAELTAETREIHRALATLCEELEAIDWYQHRLDVSQDEDLLALIQHNRNEEMEHAAMTLEWLRRRMPDLDRQLRKYLFHDGSITEGRETLSAPASAGVANQAGDLGIGALRERKVS